MTLETKLHCVKSARVRSFCGSYFPAFGMNTDQRNSEYGHFSRSDHFFKGTAKIKRWSFQGRNFISLETVGGMFTLVIIEAWQHDFVAYRETLNLLLKKSITTTDEPPRDSNFINSINIHNNSNTKPYIITKTLYSWRKSRSHNSPRWDERPDFRQ